MEVCGDEVMSLNSIFQRLLYWESAVSVRPLRVLRHRYIVRIITIVINWQLILKSWMGITGAKFVGRSVNGNFRLKLNVATELGNAGSILEMPYDDVIFRSVQMHGSWATEETRFFVDIFKSTIFSGKATFLDIGANVGLSSRQLLNETKSNMDCILVEPLWIHLEAIHTNLVLEFPSANIEIFPFALGEKNGSQVLHTDLANSGKSSLVFESAGLNRTIKTEIAVLAIGDFEKDIYRQERDFLLKCDTEGFESVICSGFSDNFWSNVKAAIIEISPLSFPDIDKVNSSLSFFRKFSKMSWDPKSRNQIGITEISDFWLSKSKQTRNLYLSE